MIVSGVINDRRKLVLGELPELSLQLHVEGDDGENQEDHHQARHCSSQTCKYVRLLQSYWETTKKFFFRSRATKKGGTLNKIQGATREDTYTKSFFFIVRPLRGVEVGAIKALSAKELFLWLPQSESKYILIRRSKRRTYFYRPLGLFSLFLLSKLLHLICTCSEPTTEWSQTANS